MFQGNLEGENNSEMEEVVNNEGKSGARGGAGKGKGKRKGKERDDAIKQMHVYQDQLEAWAQEAFDYKSSVSFLHPFLSCNPNNNMLAHRS